MCLSNQADDHSGMAPSMGSILKLCYLGLITGLRHEIHESRSALSRLGKKVNEYYW